MFLTPESLTVLPLRISILTRGNDRSLYREGILGLELFALN